jgi:DNA-binding response OmpR family regulator
MRVLLVDGHGDCRETLAQLLRAWGHAVTACQDTASASQVEPGAVDCAVIGVSPPWDGHRAGRLIRALHGPSVPLIALSVESCPAGLYDHVLAKPPDLDALRHLLDGEKDFLSRPQPLPG